MKTTLIDLFTSKKFLAALAAIIVYVAGRFGFDVDTAALDRVFAAFLVYVGAQGVADMGKSAALVRGAALAVGPTPAGLQTDLQRNPQAGFIDAPLWAILAAAAGLLLFAGAMVASCTATQARSVTAAGAVAALDCEAGSIDPAALADARLFADSRVQGWITGTAPAALVELQAKILADLKPVRSNLGRCAVAGALAAAIAVTGGAAPAPGVATQSLAEAGPDPALLRAAFAGAARAAGWAPVRLAGGEVL